MTVEEKTFFLKYRTNHAWGSSKWGFKEILYASHDDGSSLSKEQVIHEFVDTINTYYNYSEKYRGCTIEEVSTPPELWLKQRIDLLYCRIYDSQKTIKRYKKLLLKEPVVD